jgi:hypothetical protein
MYLKNRIVFGIICVLVTVSFPIFAQSPPIPQLTTIPTAEPMGKGGSSTSFGLFQHIDSIPEDEKDAKIQNVNIGGFEERHPVSLKIETFLIPVRFTYGLSDQLDLKLGATLSTGGVKKVVHDFYNIGDPLLESNRVYEQPLYDGLIGLKYNIKPDLNDGFPSISIGGDVYSGFTADDRPNSAGEFLDHSPIDGFPFVGINTYFVGTQKIARYLKIHAGAGILLSSKTLRTTDFFTLNWQAGGELALSDSMWFAADFSRELQYAGLNVSNIIGLAFRYEVSNTLAFQIGINNLPGVQFNLTLGGEKAKEMEENKLLF